MKNWELILLCLSGRLMRVLKYFPSGKFRHILDGIPAEFFSRFSATFYAIYRSRSENGNSNYRTLGIVETLISCVKGNERRLNVILVYQAKQVKDEKMARGQRKRPMVK